MKQPRIPIATYRLQFSRNFRFIDAIKIIPYLNDLGVSDIYSSPYFKSATGSTHGYNIVDHNKFNDEVGSEEDYREMVEELGKYGMGQVLDIVPNHMCISNSGNLWWMDVLENGPVSVYANYFDIEWEPEKGELKNKVLLPVLGDQYGKVLEKGELVLVFENGSFWLQYYELRLPLIPKTYMNILKHRLPALEERLGKESPGFTEYLSIITALNYLPDTLDSNPEKIAERYREKEIIKKRIWSIYSENQQIGQFIDENVKAFNGVKGEPESFDPLNELLSGQVYRLSYWRVAADEINYRRFFDVNSLAGLRVENPEVFNDTHKLVLKLVGEGSVTGLRVDHPDGLYNPTLYFRQLQEECSFHLLHGPGEASHVITPVSGKQLQTGMLIQIPGGKEKSFYIIAEKILSKGERVPEEWPICGTTGYSFLNVLNGIFVQGASARHLDRIYADFTGLKDNYQDIVYESKKLIMEVSLSGEVSTLAHTINRVTEKNRHTRDFTLHSLRKAIIEIIACFPVYRTYVNSYSVTDSDRQYVEMAVAKAKRKNPSLNVSIFDFLKDVLLLRFPEEFTGRERREWLDFTMRFQQITSPVTAKGIEDTAFYVFNRLVSLNEVGGVPDRFGTPMEAFHGQNLDRKKMKSGGLNTTSTHDTKRGEDVRVRIDVLSEIPSLWRKHLFNWSRLNKTKRGKVDSRIAPGRNEEYLLYQTLLGSWQCEKEETRGDGFTKRIKDYMIKAMREAKENTSWINPDTPYEDAVMKFIDSILAGNGDNRFLESLRAFQKKIAHFGIVNSLAQVLLKITSPGVPDFFQGTELWDLNLVDPDNRRPVDYEKRVKIMEEIKARQADPAAEIAKELWSRKADGRIKLYVIRKALHYRRKNRELFEEGDYLPIEGSGDAKNNVCGFVRRWGRKIAITLVPRLSTEITEDPDGPGSLFRWRNTWIALPFTPADKFTNIFTGEIVLPEQKTEGHIIRLKNLISCFPVALLDGIEKES